MFFLLRVTDSLQTNLDFPHTNVDVLHTNNVSSSILMWIRCLWIRWIRCLVHDVTYCYNLGKNAFLRTNVDFFHSNSV